MVKDDHTFNGNTVEGVVSFKVDYLQAEQSIESRVFTEATFSIPRKTEFLAEVISQFNLIPYKSAEFCSAQFS